MTLKFTFAPLLIVIFFLFFNCFLSAQSSLLQEYALSTKSKASPQLMVKDMSISEKIIFEKNICDRVMGRNLCPRISKSPFLIKEICRIGKRLNSFRKVHSKCGNITYRLNENGVSMKFYLTRYYMSQP